MTTTTSESGPSPVNNPLYPQAPLFSSSSNNNNQNNNNNNAGATTVAPLSSNSLQAVANKGTPATLNLDDIFGDCFFTPDGDTVFLSDQQQQQQQSQQQQQQQQDGNQNHHNSNSHHPNMIRSGESQVTHYASKPSTLTHPNQQHQLQQPPMTHSSNVYVPVAQGGGLATTNLDKNPATHRALVMGQAPASSSSSAPNSNSNNKQQQQQQQQAKPRQTVPFVQPPQQRHHMQFVAPALPNNTTTNNSNSKSSKTTKRSRGSSALAAERKMNDRQKVER
eukprot:scaffold41397_cov49-Attheya_sp.AAC.1